MKEIPEVAKWMVDFHKFTPTEQLPSGHCSDVWADETRVLKVPFRGEEMTTGASLQKQLAHRGIGPRIYAASEIDGCILMDRAIPGIKLHESDLSDLEQMNVWRDLVWRIRQCEPGIYAEPEGPDGPKGYYGPKLMPLKNFVNMHDRLCSHLIAWSKSSDEGFLHGDLHHENILKHGLHWLAIDAKGLKGDHAFEGAAYIRNPFSTVREMSVEQFRERIHKVAAALHVDRFKVWGWSVAQLRDGLPEPGTPWHHVLKCLYELAPDFGGERFVEPLT